MLERIRIRNNFRWLKKELKLLLIFNTFYATDEFLKSECLTFICDDFIGYMIAEWVF